MTRGPVSAARAIAGLLLVAFGVTQVGAQEIWEIQGSGLRSPFENQSVSTSQNTVTAVGSGFFFIQTPESRSDRDPWTSDGILVDAPSTPRVTVGDRVSVSGTVVEYYGQTEIGGAVAVTVGGSGHPLPGAVAFDGDLPSPNQPWPETELERFEGMRVLVADGLVTGPTDRYGDARITASGMRLYREPGIAHPGLPGLPVWDGNPEVFEIDPDALGEDHVELVAGSRLTAEGVLAYTFGDYQIWPTSLEVSAVPELPIPASDRAASHLSVASQNLYRLARTGGDLPYDDRLDKLSVHIREVLGSPDVLAVQEVDSLSVLRDLEERIESDDPTLEYTAYLEEGNDSFGIDVGFLVRDTVHVDDVGQVGADVVFTWDGSLLFDRPPLVLEIEAAAFSLTVVVVHLKSLNGIDDPGSSGDRVRHKRFEQSEWLAEWLQDRQMSDPEEAIMIIGDLNAFEFSDGYVDVVGQITGSPDPAGALLAATEVVEPPLENLVLRLPPEARYSYIYRGSAEVLDHALVARTASPLVRGVSFCRGNADVPVSAGSEAEHPLRSSDHDGLVITLGPAVRGGGDRRRTPSSPAF